MEIGNLFFLTSVHFEPQVFKQIPSLSLDVTSPPALRVALASLHVPVPALRVPVPAQQPLAAVGANAAPQPQPLPAPAEARVPAPSGCQRTTVEVYVDG